MAVPIFVVDAFASRPFTGNPAGVCLLQEAAEAEWMQSVAGEMKHAETAFVSPNEDGTSFDLRWFTPTTEVDLCGHATLASAHTLWEQVWVEESVPAVFRTKSGTLTCTRHGYGIQMDFPAEPPKTDDSIELAEIERVLRLAESPLYVGSNRMDALIELASEEVLCNLEPDMDLIAELPFRGLIVTSRSKGDHDFVSRFFGPAAGVPEDPVTGSAHCCLGPYWAEKLAKKNVLGYQASARGGTVRVSVLGDRVLLQGAAITVLRGELFV